MTIESSRKKVARNFVLTGLGIALLYLPALSVLLGIVWLTRILFFLAPLTFLGGFYVIGLGVAGVIVGIVELVREVNGVR